MRHNFIDYNKIDKKLDDEVSKLYKYKNTSWFIQKEEDLKKINKKIYPNKEHDFFAWKYRILPSKAWKVVFIEAFKIPKTMEAIFAKKRKTFWEILWWTIETISIVHPFLDWNRRSIWHYTNMWLDWEWYEIINWEFFRPIWEDNKYLENTDFLNTLLKYFLEQKQIRNK